jgi:hypothetical protein
MRNFQQGSLTNPYVNTDVNKSVYLGIDKSKSLENSKLT